MKIAMSACLLGEACRYDGKSKPCAAVTELAKHCDEVLAICPEVAGGLSIPRPPAERQGSRVVTREGVDVTAQYFKGAQIVASQVLASDIPLAVLKAKSPACGSKLIYDGTYSNQLMPGQGVLAELLIQEGICVVDEEVILNHKPSFEHPVAIVLGSGLGHLAGLVKPVRHIDYYDIEGFPARALPVEGHTFKATIGTIDDVPVVVYPGRLHLYQGYSAAEVTSLVRHAHSLGCRDIIFACATGAIVPEDKGLGVIVDQINLTGVNPLVEHDPRRAVETPFVGMTQAYSPYMIQLACSVAKDHGIWLNRGVLAGTVGPSFETPAEVRALALLGVSYVGMSVVNEVIMAHALGMNVLGLTQAGNQAGDPNVSHESILAASETYQTKFETLVRGVLQLL